jgi:hypothetical protein
MVIATESSQWTPLAIGILITGIFAAVGSTVATILGAMNRTDVLSTKKTGEATHILTNSAMGQQLLDGIADKQALSVVLHTLATNSGKPEDLAAAIAMDVRVKAAEVKYQQHQRNQAIVDEKMKTV